MSFNIKRANFFMKSVSQKITFKSTVLVALSLMLTFTIAMPNQAMALWLFDQKDKPKDQSVLNAEKVDTVQTQKIAEPSMGAGDTKQSSKTDRSQVRELAEKRTPFTSTFLNKDGTKTMEYSVDQKNYKDGSTWKKINNSLNAIRKEVADANLFQTLTNTAPKPEDPNEFRGTAGVVKTSIKPLAEGISIEANDKTFVMKPVGAKNITPVQKDDRTVIYKDAWPHVDVEYELRGETVKEIIILKSNKAQSNFNFAVSGGKVIAHPTRAGELTIEGLPTEFSFSSLTLDVNERGVISEKRVSQSPSKDGIEVKMDSEWLKSQPNSAFPMKIDPSFGRDATSYWMFKSDGISCGSNNCYANTGTIDDNGWKHWRTYFQFPFSDMAGKKILDANLHGYYKTGQNGIGDGRGIGMGHANCISFNCLGYQVGGVNGVGGDFDINFTAGLQTSVNNSDWATAWSLWGEEGGYKSFKPYYNLKATVTYDTPTPQTTPVEPADKQVTISTEPTLRVNPVGDADGDAVKYYYRVSTSPDAETGAVINSGWVTTTQWTIPEGILQDGTTYYWHVYTLGATQTNPNWVRSFKVDLRTGKDSTQAYDTVGPLGIDLATGNATTSTDTHTMNALGGSIGLSMNYNTPAKAKNGLIGQYWNVTSGNTSPSGDPLLVRNDGDINFSWQSGSSPGSGINDDWFVAKWKGYFVAPNKGSYKFGASNDDALSMSVGNQTFGGCYGSAPCYNNNSIDLEAGQSIPIEVQLTEATGDSYAKVYVKGAVPEQIIPRDWLRAEVQASQSQYGLKGYYYTDNGSHTFPSNNSDPMRLMMARNDSKISFNWGTGAPASGLQADNFMTRWTGYITVPASGNYTFGATADDGIRVKLNNGFMGAQQTVLDSWQYTPTLVWGNAQNLTAGQQIPITVEYFEVGGGASMTLRVKGPDGVDQEMPVKWLTPKATALPNSWQLGVDVDGDVGYERLRVAGSNVVLEDSTRMAHEYTWTGSGFKPPVNEDGQLVRNANNTYTFTDVDGRTYIFDAEGKLTSLTSATDDRKPANIKYEYAGDPSRLMKIVDGVNSARYGTLHYKSINEDGNCSVPSGFSAAPDGMLCAFKTSDGDVTKLYYKSDQLSRIEKPGNEKIDYGYDSFGRIVETRDSVANDVIAAGIRADDNSVKTEVTYDTLGRADTIKAPAPTAGESRVNHTFEYQISGTVPLYRQGMGPNGDHRLSITSFVPGYSMEFKHGSLLSAEKPGTHALYSCMLGWDELISTDSNCEGQAKNGLLGYAYDIAQATVPTVALYRCMIGGEHFTSLSSNCDGFTNEGIRGYILDNSYMLGATQMHIAGAPEPNGFSKRVEYDSLLRTTKETDLTNLSSTTEWDSVKDLELSKTDATGLKSTTIYDDDDRPIESYGPAPAAWYGADRKPLPANSNQVPKTSTGYDEGMSGLAVAYMASNAPNQQNTLGNGQTLYKDQSLWSLDRRFQFSYQGDGNMVVYGPNGSGGLTPQWSSSTLGLASNRLVMQSDGNLVLYNVNTPVWSTGITAGTSSANFVMQNDGNAVVYRSNGSTWATNSGGWQTDGPTNVSLTGAPLLHATNLATDGTISRSFGTTSPIPNHTGSWGVSMTGKMKLPSVGNWNFRINSDNGVRVWIDDVMVQDDWYNEGQRFHPTFTYNNQTANSLHRVRIDYYHNTSSAANFALYMTAPSGSETANVAQYFNPAYGLKTSETAYDTQLGNVTSTTTYNKPEYGLVDKTTLDPTGLNMQSAATYETPGSGFLRQTSKTLPGGGTTTYQHYGADETRDNPCTSEIESIIQAGRPKGKIEADPDGAGSQVARTSESIYNHAGEIVATRYNSDAWTCTTYDARGRVLTTSIPAIGTQSSRTIANDYQKDGNPLITTTTDSKGTIRAENDLLGRTTKYIDVQGKVTQNTYDMYGKLTSRTSPLGTEAYEYDQYDRLTKQKLDGVTYATVTYDLYSRLASVQYPAGVSLSNISRDTLGRENGTSFTVSSSTSSPSNNPSAIQTLRQGADTASISSADGGGYDGTPHNPTTFTLNGLNGTYDSTKTSQFSLPVDAGSSVGNGTQARISYDFTGDGAWDRQETYNYFATDPVTGYETYTQSKGLQSSTGTFTNLQNGKVKVEVWNAIGNGTSTVATSQTAGSTQSTLTLPFTMSSGTQTTNATPTTYTDTIERYVSGDIKQGTENGVTKQYTYDNAGRLTGATVGSNVFTYEFGTPDISCSGLAGNNPNAGKNGNRTRSTMNGQVTTYCYDMADRLIASSDATLTNPQYDSHGNTTSLGNTTNKTEFRYDSSDRNIAIKANNIETLFGRDVQDRIVTREHKENNTTTSNVSYGFTGSGDSPDFLLDSTGNVTQKYLTLPGDVIVTMKPSNTGAAAATYSLPNIHGDIYLTVDADGTVKSTHQTGPFGEVLSNQTIPDNTTSGTSWNYVGQHQKITDQNTSPITGGIIQMGARVYIPAMGRFLSVDSVEGGADNNYVYANDPVNQNDLDGRAVKRYVKPNPLRGYSHYLFGGGRSVNMNANKISWSVSQSEMKRLGTGSFKNRQLGATARGFSASEHVGSVSGKFNGSIKKVGNQYTASGTFSPGRDRYNFDINLKAPVKRNLANAVGLSVGAYIRSRSLGIIQPKSYYINFNGSGKVR